MSVEQNMETLLQAAQDESAELPKAWTTVLPKVEFTQTGRREVRFIATVLGKEVSRFHISLVPGCRRVAVFHGVTVDPEFRNQRLGEAPTWVSAAGSGTRRV